MKVGQIIQRIQSLYSKGVQSDDTRLTDSHIYDVMLTTRSTLLTNKINKKQKISDWNYMTLPCVEIIKVDKHECPCLPPVGCKVYRTKYPLPKPLVGLTDHIIDWVMSVEDSLLIDKATREEIRRLNGNKYTSHNPKYLTEQRHFYFYASSLGKVIKLRFLPEDPIEASKYPSFCPCTDCNDCESYYEKEFPFDLEDINVLVQMCAAELIEQFSKSREDRTNDTKDKINE